MMAEFKKIQLQTKMTANTTPSLPWWQHSAAVGLAVLILLWFRTSFCCIAG